MTASPHDPFYEQFIDDYFAECAEHLAVVRRSLLVLEEGEGRAIDTATRHALQRSLHTLKGLSGMVGLSSAERVAHTMEEWLRDAGDGPVDARGLRALFEGVRLLETCIASRRNGDQPPDTSGYEDEASEALPGHAGAIHAPVATTVHVAPVETPVVAMPNEDASIIYRFEFSPSKDLAGRGVGVETVRTRLQTLGALLDVQPRVRAGGGVAFEFTVSVPFGAAPDDRWREDALTWVAEEPATSTGMTLAPRTLTPLAAPPIDHAVATTVAAPIATAHTTPAVSLGTSNTVRVDLSRLDDIMRMVGDLVVSRSRLDDTLQRLQTHGAASDAAALDETLRETSAAIERQVRALREGVMRIRLVPVGEAFERMRFAARDLARELHKSVALELTGQTTEIDKLVVDRMIEPLLHLVRNAMSHGIESPDERRARGKPAEGRLALRAWASGDRIMIEVEDDGAGIDMERVAARARELGLIDSRESLEGETLLDVLCAPGFSTRNEADLASGRGVGMAVVRSSIRALGGELTLTTVEGRGSRFLAELPLTLMIVDALLVEIGPHLMAVPQPVLREILRLDPSTATRFEANAVIAYRSGVLPLVSLRQMFALPRSASDHVYVLVVGSEAHPTGLMVDRVLGLREIVVHAVTDPLVAMPGIGGATELGDGRVCLILDAAELVRYAQEHRDMRVTSPRPMAALPHGANGY